MSTLLYAKAPQIRKSLRASGAAGGGGGGGGGGDDGGGGEGVTKYAEALAGLVPAEALALHAVILGFTTKTDGGTTTITDASVLGGCFWALLAISVLLYVFGRWRLWGGLDYIKVFVPPLAFFLWMLLQRTSAFDAVNSSWSGDARQAIGVLGAVVLAAIAGLIAYKAP